MDAVEIFKELHTSKKKGMTDVVKEIVVSAYMSDTVRRGTLSKNQKTTA